MDKWVNEKTNGKIKSIIENLSPDVMIVLLNAIYFKGSWEKKFDDIINDDEKIAKMSENAKSRHGNQSKAALTVG